MCQSGRLGNVGVETADGIYVIGLLSEEPLGNAPRDLRNFERMRETIVKNVALLGRYHLCDFCETCKRTGVKNTIPITLRRATPVRSFFSV
jgi:hypothetical protein